VATLSKGAVVALRVLLFPPEQMTSGLAIVFALLAGAGIIGLAVGLGAQKLVQDVITGVFILLEDSVAVGDVVTVAGIGGLAEDLSIRSIRLRDLSGNVHTVPFSSINTVTSMTKLT
jgi:small-conductance mechanosensitive channel